MEQRNKALFTHLIELLCNKYVASFVSEYANKIHKRVSLLESLKEQK